jgi:hypothetical protein
LGVGAIVGRRDDPARLGLVPAPVKLLGGETELYDQIAGQVLGLDIAALFPLKPQQERLISADERLIEASGASARP